MVVNLDYVLFQNSGFLGYTRNNSECFVFPNMSCCPLLPAFRLGEGDNDAKVLHFSEIRGMDAAFLSVRLVEVGICRIDHILL